MPRHNKIEHTRRSLRDAPYSFLIMLAQCDLCPLHEILCALRYKTHYNFEFQHRVFLTLV